MKTEVCVRVKKYVFHFDLRHRRDSAWMQISTETISQLRWLFDPLGRTGEIDTTHVPETVRTRHGSPVQRCRHNRIPTWVSNYLQTSLSAQGPGITPAENATRGDRDAVLLFYWHYRHYNATRRDKN